MCDQARRKFAGFQKAAEMGAGRHERLCCVDRLSRQSIATSALPLPKYSPEPIGYGQPIWGRALMKRRATTGGKVGKARRRSTQGRRQSPLPVAISDAATRQLASELELSEALEQQTATARCCR